MSDRTDDPGRTGRDEPGEARPRIRITDRRRVRGGEEAAPAPTGEPGAAEPRAVEEEPAGPTGKEPADELGAARRQAAEYLDDLRRVQAEFENYRKQEIKRATLEIERATERLIAQLLEVLDEFELALLAAEQKPDFEKFLRGVELVYAKLVDTLRGEGLERIEAKGHAFDPERHEALMGSTGGDGDLLVADVLRPGYTLRGRVIRPAGVRVAHEDE